MQKIKQYSSLLITATTPLTRVVRKPGLVELWLFSASWIKLYLLIGLLLLFFAASPISQSIVDLWYPE